MDQSTIDSWDTLLNDQVQNLLAFYTVAANKPALVPTTQQLQAESSAPITTQLFAPGNSGSLVLIALVAVGAVLLLREL